MHILRGIIVCTFSQPFCFQIKTQSILFATEWMSLSSVDKESIDNKPKCDTIL